MRITPNPHKPSSMDMEIMFRQSKIENAIAYFIDLYKDDVAIDEAAIQNKVLSRYGLSDASAAELEYIGRKITEAIEA